MVPEALVAPVPGPALALAVAAPVDSPPAASVPSPAPAALPVPDVPVVPVASVEKRVVVAMPHPPADPPHPIAEVKNAAIPLALPKQELKAPSDSIHIDAPATTIFNILNGILQDFTAADSWNQLIQLPVFARFFKQYYAPSSVPQDECEVAIRGLISLCAGRVDKRPPVPMSTIATIIRACPLIRTSCFIMNNATNRNFDDFLKSGDPTTPTARKALSTIIERHAINAAEKAELTAFVEQRIAAWPPTLGSLYRPSSIRAFLEVEFLRLEEQFVCDAIASDTLLDDLVLE